MMHRIPIGLLALTCLAGCLAQPGADRRADAARVDHLLYYSWWGMSPGAGFKHTSLTAIEVDLAGGRTRQLARTAQAPAPMLPWLRPQIASLLHASPWQTLPPERIRGLRGMLRLWLDTNPPPSYSRPMSLGREDGYAEVLVLQTAGRERTCDVNPRGAAGAQSPPPEWHALLAYLNALAGQSPRSQSTGIQPIAR